MNGQTEEVNECKTKQTYRLGPCRWDFGTDLSVTVEPVINVATASGAAPMHVVGIVTVVVGATVAADAAVRGVADDGAHVVVVLDVGTKMNGNEVE